MANVQWFANSGCVAVDKPLPFEVSQNFYKAVAQCVDHAGNEPTYMRFHMAIIPVDSERRLVVFA